MTAVKILSNDPGGKPGYALLDCTSTVQRKYMHRALPPLPMLLGAWGVMPSPAPAADVCVTELQWLYTMQKREAILTLAPRAGWQLCVMCLLSGGTPHALRPVEWRAALRVPPAVDKATVAARVERSLLPVEMAYVRALRLSPKRMGDIYDAIAIGWADFLEPHPWIIPP